jgi:hypothetical protein
MQTGAGKGCMYTQQEGEVAIKQAANISGKFMSGTLNPALNKHFVSLY